MLDMKHKDLINQFNFTQETDFEQYEAQLKKNIMGSPQSYCRYYRQEQIQGNCSPSS